MVKDSTGSTSATLEFYESQNNGGVDKGTAFDAYQVGAHPDGFNTLSPYWKRSAGGVGDYPYVGKSTTNRGSDAGENNAPTPTGVKDLQIHPNENDH